MHHFEAHELADSWELRAGLLDADPADASISACLRECAAALRNIAVQSPAEAHGDERAAFDALLNAMTKIVNGCKDVSALGIDPDELRVVMVKARAALAHPQPKGTDPEAAAAAVYACFAGSEHHPWVPGGNSLKQDEARRYARAALEPGMTPRKGSNPPPPPRENKPPAPPNPPPAPPAQAPAPAHEPLGYLSEHTGPDGPFKWQFSKTLAGVYRDTATPRCGSFPSTSPAPKPPQ